MFLASTAQNAATITIIALLWCVVLGGIVYLLKNEE